MDRQDLEFEELVVPESVGLPFHGLDLVVGPFKAARANRAVVLGKQTGSVCVQRVGHLMEHGGSRSLGPPGPVVEKRGDKSLAWLLPELLQVLFEVVGKCQGFVQLQGLLRALSLASVGVEVSYGTNICSKR
jgi:hypothetical protein